MHYKNIYKNEHMDIKLMMSPNPPTDGEHCQNPQQKGKYPHNILISLKRTNALGSQQLSLGGSNEGEAPHTEVV